MNKRTKRVWAGVVNYANGVATDPSELRRIIADCMPWVTASEPFGLLDPIGDDEELLNQALKYRTSVYGLLRWFCNAKSKERDPPAGFGFFK